MSYTAKDLVRAYKQRPVYGSITANAKKMGMSGENLGVLLKMLDRKSPKYLKKITKQAWYMIHAGDDDAISTMEPAPPALRGPLTQGPFKGLDEIVQAFEDDIADFITRAVEKEAGDIVHQQQREVLDKNKKIDELTGQIADLKIIAEVARKENRLVALTKKFFHED